MTLGTPELSILLVYCRCADCRQQPVWTDIGTVQAKIAIPGPRCIKPTCVSTEIVTNVHPGRIPDRRSTMSTAYSTTNATPTSSPRRHLAQRPAPHRFITDMRIIPDSSPAPQQLHPGWVASPAPRPSPASSSPPASPPLRHRRHHATASTRVGRLQRLPARLRHPLPSWAGFTSSWSTSPPLLYPVGPRDAHLGVAAEPSRLHRWGQQPRYPAPPDIVQHPCRPTPSYRSWDVHGSDRYTLHRYQKEKIRTMTRRCSRQKQEDKTAYRPMPCSRAVYRLLSHPTV